MNCYVVHWNSNTADFASVKWNGKPFRVCKISISIFLANTYQYIFSNNGLEVSSAQQLILLNSFMPITAVIFVMNNKMS